jgi:iron complex outermembrane receptor protein
MRAASNTTKVLSHEGEKENMNRRILFVSAIAAASFALLAATGGETTNSIDTIVVEATRLESGKMETPQFVETFSKAELRESGARDIMDALERNASVFVRHIGGGNPAMTQISMRGYGETSIGRVLVKADGEILNNFDMSGSDFSRFPLSSVERIEVLHGPQTVMHGGNASAGMINIITEKPGYDEEGFIEFRGGSWETFGSSIGLKGGDEDEMVSYYANGAWDHSEGWRDSSGYDFYRLNGGVRKDFSGGSFVKLSSFFSDSEYDLPGPLTFAEWKSDRRAADPDYSFYNYRQTS